MKPKRADRRAGGILKHHSLGLAVVGIVVVWIGLYAKSDPKTHLGSFFGNAIADWMGVVVAVIATKYFYEIGSSESRQPPVPIKGRILDLLKDHSLTLFLAATGLAWLWLYVKLDSESKWGQVAGNIVSEWTQQLGVVLLTKKLLEDRSKESKK